MFESVPKCQPMSDGVHEDPLSLNTSYCPSSTEKTLKCPQRPSHTENIPPAHTTIQSKHTKTKDGGLDPNN